MMGDSPISENDPRMIAWREYKATERFTIARRWAQQDAHVDGSLWDAFEAGHQAADALEWQPIADAPRDGTEVFVWKKGAPVVRATIWRVRPDTQTEWVIRIVREVMPGVPDAFPVVTRLGDPDAPTHFMPLPQPPEGE